MSMGPMTQDVLTQQYNSQGSGPSPQYQGDGFTQNGLSQTGFSQSDYYSSQVGLRVLASLALALPVAF